MFNNDYGMGISLKKAGLFAIGGFIALNAIDWMSFQAGQDDRGKQATMMSITDQLVASKKDWTLGVNVISALDTPESSPGAWMRWREARVGSPAGEAISKLGPEAVSKHHPKTIWMVPGNSAYFDDNGVEYINEQMIPKRSPFSLNINIKENKIINGRTADVLWDREQLLGDY